MGSIKPLKKVFRDQDDLSRNEIGPNNYTTEMTRDRIDMGPICHGVEMN